MLHFRLLNDDRDGRLAVPDVTRPLGVSHCGQSTRHSFVQAIGGELDGMFDAFDVATRDSARPMRQAVFVTDSLFIRHPAI
jgi:hypothetical protein